MCKCFFLQALDGCSISIYAMEVCSISIYAMEVCSISIYAMEVCSISIYAVDVFLFLFCFAANLAQPGAAVFVHFLPMKSRDTLAHDIIYMFAMSASHVHDVMDTDCQQQNGSTQGYVFVTLKHQSLTN